MSKEKILAEIKEMISKKDPKLNKKAKRLAMKNQIKLGKLRREFCQKCFASLDFAKKRIRKKYISLTCSNCGKKTKWRT